MVCSLSDSFPFTHGGGEHTTRIVSGLLDINGTHIPNRITFSEKSWKVKSLHFCSLDAQQCQSVLLRFEGETRSFPGTKGRVLLSQTKRQIYLTHLAAHSRIPRTLTARCVLLRSVEPTPISKRMLTRPCGFASVVALPTGMPSQRNQSESFWFKCSM